MSKIIEIKEDFLENLANRMERIAVRGIIRKDKELLMVYSSYFDDYTFPGGGLEEGESLEDCLKREVLEEVGAIIQPNYKYIGYVEQFSRGIRDQNCMLHQFSHYYLCEVESYTKPRLEEYEIEFGYEARWIDIQKAIMHNESCLAKAKNIYPVEVKRCIEVLKYLVENEVKL